MLLEHKEARRTFSTVAEIVRYVPKADHRTMRAPVEAPTLGIWSSNDHYLDRERMKISGRFVKGPWRYEEIDGVSHWIPLDAPDRLNQLLLEWLVD